MATTKRSINLDRRQVRFTNLNFSPEKAGDDLVERSDLDFEILLDEKDIGQILKTKGNPLRLLWDKDGEITLRELAKPLELNLKLVGTLRLAAVGGDGSEELVFEDAVFKKPKLTPMIGHKASLHAQVRVEPTGMLEALGQMRVREECVLAFAGGAEAERNDNQSELKV